MPSQEIKMYTVDDLCKIFKCGLTQAYKIAKANGFPSIKVGGRILVEGRALEQWLDKSKGREIRL